MPLRRDQLAGDVSSGVPAGVEAGMVEGGGVGKVPDRKPGLTDIIGACAWLIWRRFGERVEIPCSELAGKGLEVEATFEPCPEDSTGAKLVIVVRGK